MTLAVKPRNSLVPFILDVYDADLPTDANRVVARCDTRTGDIWRTRGAASKPTMPEVLCAIEESGAA